MKNYYILFCCILSLSYLNGQSWQQEYELPGIPTFLEESSSSELKVIYLDTLTNQWTKVVFDQAGNFVGNEIFIPDEYIGVHIIVEEGSEKFLTKFDPANNIIWQTALTNIPNSASLSVTNSGLSIIDFNESSGPSSTIGKILVFDVNGNQVFNRTANGPLALNGWNIKYNNDGSLFITKYSRDPFIPQGAGSTVYEYFKINSLGEIVCTDNGNSSNWAASRVVHRMAKNGNNSCGAIGRISAGLWNPENPSGQFIPCTNQLAEFPIIPIQTGMIGLQSNAFATLGIRNNQTVLTRIDCSDPIINKLCLGTIRSDYEYSICQGDSLSFADTTVNTAGYYERLFVTERGCDSLITLNLSVDTNTISIDPQITSGGVYYMIYLNADCDNCTYSWSNGGNNSGNLVTQDYGWRSVVITAPSGCSLTYEFYLEPLVTATEDLADKTIFRIPNPAQSGSVVTVYTDLPLHTSYNIKIFDIQGRIWRTQKIKNSLENEITLPNNSGIYFVGLYQENKIIALQKIVIY